MNTWFRNPPRFARNKRDSYMVGALARLNLNYDKLLPGAKALADSVGLKTCYFKSLYE